MLEKLLRNHSTFLISLFFSGGTVIYTTPGCDPLEEDRKVDDIYIPKCGGDVNNIDLNQLERQLSGGYSKVNRKKEGGFSRDKYLSAKVTVSLNSDANGFMQPTVSFHNNLSISESILVTNIDEVKGILLKDKDDKDNPILWLSYSEPIGVNLPAFKRSYFILEAKEEWKGAAEALCTLSRHYRREKIMWEKQKIPQKESATETSEQEATYETSKQLPLQFYLTRAEQQEICKNGTISGKEVSLLTTLTFDNCVYSPGESTSGLVELNQKIKSLNLSTEGALLACGHATIPAADGCQPEIQDYNNFELSFDRANATAVYIENDFPNQMGHLTMNVYPHSTNLNERMVRVYYVTTGSQNQK